jgi:Ca2+-binding RTX toxin-like protein
VNRVPGRSLLSALLGLVLGTAVGVVTTELAWAPPNETINCPSSGPCDGTAANDHIHGTGGFDNIDGRGGSDIVEGRPHGDQVGGEDQDDIVTGEDGPDTVNGGTGFDSYVSGGKLFGLHGEHGGDTIHGGEGGDTLSGGNNDDLLVGGTADGDHDHCDGGPGFDTFERCHRHQSDDQGILGDPFG